MEIEHYVINETHRIQTQQLDVYPRFLFGPGPSNAHPRILQAMSMRMVGHLDPQFLALMDEIQELLRYAWQTDNRFTIPVSGTGSAAMEASLANLIEPGDKILVGVNGYFGNRMVDMAERYGAEVHQLRCPWGEVFSLEEIRQGLEKYRPAILGLVHAETSTGACQPFDGIGDLCRQYDCLLLADTVTSLGGVPLLLDAWKIDVAYSGSQKCLNCPPGIAPLTLGDRALAKLKKRKSKVANWYLDMTMLMNYWGENRTYHHTAPINMNYGLREALRIVAEEGLEARWKRHQTIAQSLWDGLAEMDLACHVAREYRLPSLTTVVIPEGVDDKAVRQRLLKEFNIEIAGGLGELSGKVWRVGLMGFNSRSASVALLLSALKIAIAGAGK
ncbi:MAG: alanine--glyoxylate aminotransferase family protein [Calditrichaeota bacterium]|nr:alanine--glyoxylate aminotransferase family protein [Calditrichota bacterium]MCB0305384.1 alanine--glyoxylate aminotransferase family protein [Calditrichota bacterium]MCB9089638.1 alanine--glyoxylate aminotransferase family protein [Calditrichia bacterium]